MFKVPGFAPMLDLFGATSGPRSKLIALLKEGQTIIISPGGVREALFSKDYEILWVSLNKYIETNFKIYI